MSRGIYIRTEKIKRKQREKMKGKHSSPATEFKKGMIPFSKLHPEIIPRGKIHYMFGKHLSEKAKKILSNFRKTKTGIKSSNWQGGGKIDKGYVFLYKSDHPFAKRNYISEHRLIVEKQINRYLISEESCHHLNKIKIDNRPKNLMAFATESAHKRVEMVAKIKSNEIIIDESQHKRLQNLLSND